MSEKIPSLADSVRTSPEVLYREIGGEAVLLDLASERYFGLDPVGTRVWQLVREQGSLRAVFDRMLAEFDVDPARLEEDLLRHIAELADAGLLVVAEGDGTTL